MSPMEIGILSVFGIALAIFITVTLVKYFKKKKKGKKNDDDD